MNATYATHSIYQMVQDWQQGNCTSDDVARYAACAAGARARDLMAEGVAWWQKIGRQHPLTLGQTKANPSWAR